MSNEKHVQDQSSVPISEGVSAPDFVMTDASGRAISLTSFRGKKNVVVYFYPKDFTPGCSTEAAEFSREYNKFTKAGVEIVGVSPDNENSHAKFRSKMGIPYPLVADVGNTTSKSYGVFGKKNFMGKEYMGVNRTTFLIDKSGKIVKVFGRVKPAGHGAEVLCAFLG